jgi:tetratricopeptide (TPR) repeat protein
VIAAGDIVMAPEPARRAVPPEPTVGIPPAPIEHLAGREADLAALHQLLGRSRRVAIHGLGGVGKTQLAIAYLSRHRSACPDGCFWLRADQSTTLLADLASLAWRVQLPERELPEQELQIEAVLRWLRDHDRWLLVVDNLDRPVAEKMRHWLPPDLPGHLIITSRSPHGLARLALEPLPMEVAAGFLLRRTGKDDAAAARDIAETVGGLPLALEQAAAYLIENDWRSLAEYAELMRRRMAELLRSGKPEDYPLPVATTWDISFQRIEQEQPAAAALLRLCAFLAPDDIPIGVLQAGADQFPDQLAVALRDEIECDRVVRTLRDYSLVARQGDSLRVHRLVQWVVRDSLATEHRARWMDRVTRLLVRAFPDEVNDPESWPLCRRLLPHAQAAIELLGREGPDPEDICRLMTHVAGYLRARADYARAQPLLERALESRERVLGPDHPETARSLHDLAWLVREKGEYVAARRLIERALAIRERVLGPDHPDTAWSLHNLGWLLHQLGEFAGSRSACERALEIRERTLGPDHADTASSLNALAATLRRQGELTAARLLHERALEIQIRRLGPAHPDTAWTIYALARLFREQGELTTARPLCERALEIRERVLGPDHLDVSYSLSDLSELLRAQGDLVAAQSLCERVLELQERVLGSDHAYPTTARASLAIIRHDTESLQVRGTYALAISHFEHALATREQVFGPEHPDTATSLNDLAVLLQAQGELAVARTNFERALAIREKMLGPEHPKTAHVLNNLGLLLRDLGELEAARPYLERALAIREKVLGHDHLHAAVSRQALESLQRSPDE